MSIHWQRIEVSGIFRRWFFPQLLGLCSLVLIGSVTGCGPVDQTVGHSKISDSVRQMNLLLIVADDMGYSDLGSFGGHAATPNLDKLALDGIRLSNFHAAPSCSPSRAQLLSSADNHRVGLGNMAELLSRYPWQQGKPGYEGYLTKKAVTVATALQEHGYRTFMSGKWHMGHAPDYVPTARGFDRSFALMGGTSSHFAADNGRRGHETIILENGQEVEWPSGQYSSDVYTDKLLEYLEEDPIEERPFFAYLAFTAPHHPLHAPQAAINKYAGVFDAGYEALMAERIQSMKALGILPDKDITLYPHPKARPWDSLSAHEKKLQSRYMQVYAAMLDNMDQNVGRVLDHLQRTGELDNTLIVFLSDNGASDQELASFPIWKERYESSNNALDNIGNADSWTGIGAGWAQAVSAPNRLAKHRTSEGGIRVPAFVWHAGIQHSARVSHAFAHIKDVAPTLLDYAQINLGPEFFLARNAVPWSGKSLRNLISGEAAQVHSTEDAFGWEHREQFALIKGDWKILQLPPPYGTGNWELYNLAEDTGEAKDLAASHPARLAELKQDWDNYVQANNVIVRVGGVHQGSNALN